ncbi:hypothetical protein AGMMS49949_00800 [Alphaproteobacteria bacterium]|nr:hypothetical protein AGMMS49949_00800 [Alphaproteobacteria bacterium]GHS95796.1 hypothetical protein AGMMS50296_0950 [Alphaproteobacteria bacterium]
MINVGNNGKISNMFHKEIKTKEAKKKLEEFAPKFKSGAKGEDLDRAA